MLSYMWKGTDGKFWHVTGPMQFKRAVDEAEANSIRYYAKGTAAGGPGAGGWTLIEWPSPTDPAVIPGLDITHLASGGGDVGPIAVTGTLSGTLSGTVSGNVSGSVSGSISGATE